MTTTKPTLSDCIFGAILCGLLVYLPGGLFYVMSLFDPNVSGRIPWLLRPLLMVIGIIALGIRGGLFCMFPGLCLKNRKLIWTGFLTGFAADAVISVIAATLGPTWSTRGPSSPFLQIVLPPFLNAPNIRPTHSPWSFYAIRIFETSIWMAAMLTIWLRIWQPRLKIHQGIRAVIYGTAISLVMTWLLCMLMPVHAKTGPFAVLYIFFVMCIPLPSMIAAVLMHRYTRLT